MVNLGIDRPNLSPRHWIHFPEKEISFFRMSYPHNFSPRVAPRGTSSISAEVAYSASATIDKSTIVERVVEDLRRVEALGRQDRIVSTATYDIPYAYCIYDLQRAEAPQNHPLLDEKRRSGARGALRAVDLLLERPGHSERKKGREAGPCATRWVSREERPA